MHNAAKYSALWKTRLPLIKQYLKMTRNGEQGIQLSKAEFRTAGERGKYGFSLSMDKGKVTNNIDSSAVARDLALVLQTDVEAKAWLIEKNITMSLDKDFILKIRQNNLPVAVEEVVPVVAQSEAVESVAEVQPVVE